MIYHVQQIRFVMYYKYDSSIKHTLFVLPNKYDLFCTTNMVCPVQQILYSEYDFPLQPV